jgi:hemoglobin/transferrin/lactoferrin receptor protein
VLQIAVENILDTHYKAFASGLSAPGRNVIMSLKTVF